MAHDTRADTERGVCGHDFSSLAQALSSLRDKRPVFIPNPGNAGDSLIAANSYRFFEAIGLKVEVGHYLHIYPDRHIIYGGGGNLINHYDEAKGFITRNFDSLRSFILLPHTVRGNEDLLATLDARFSIFAREDKTYAYTKDAAPRARTEISHDMAFFADPRHLSKPLFWELARTTKTPGNLRSNLYQQRTWYRHMGKRSQELGVYPPKGNVLNAFRTDVESTGQPSPEDNVDVSKHFMHPPDHGPFMSRRIVAAMVDLISRYETIRTDRLHVTILAALLGKQVEVRDNDYGKLASIHAHSMRDFQNVRFVDP